MAPPLRESLRFWRKNRGLTPISGTSVRHNPLANDPNRHPREGARRAPPSRPSERHRLLAQRLDRFAGRGPGRAAGFSRRAGSGHADRAALPSAGRIPGDGRRQRLARAPCGAAGQRPLFGRPYRRRPGSPAAAISAMRSIAFLAGALFAGLALAQPYPSKPLRMIVPFPPGGVTDVMSRAVAARLSAEMGQPVVVENRAGASGIIGAEAGARAPADGYTITMGNTSTLAVNSATFAKLPYDPVTSFAPISMVAIQPLVGAVDPALPVQSLPDLVRYAKSKHSVLSYCIP